jgi:subtilase family serine protease
MKKYFAIFALIFYFLIATPKTQAAYHFANFKGKPPIHISASSSKIPAGLTPDQVKAIYNLPKTGGNGTVAVIDAYDDQYIEKDLGTFSKQFNLPDCTVKNGCLEVHKMSSTIKTNSGWRGETSLDIEWIHAIAPNAKILLVEATTPSGTNLINAVDYAAGRKDVVAVSMSWGGAEFPEEVSMDSHFISKYGAIFFASSGDNGAGASWPASSPNVIGVGGTTVAFLSGGTFKKETAWDGSGGGVSAYEKQPSYQSNYSIAKSNSMRAIPDVSYNADPASGFSVYWSSSATKGVWYVVGGTSAGAPQWAAIQSLGLSVSNTKLYSDKEQTNYADYFRDITSGTNGSCTFFCTARKHYDYITGLGSPLTVKF